LSWSFDKAARRLKDLCHLHVSDDTIERVCQEEGRRAQHWLQQPDRAAGRKLKEAEGELEFYTDGLQVNTVGGWREMRLSVLAKRPAGLPVQPEQWKDRVLPEPTARVAFCAIAPSHWIGSSWRRMLKSLGLEDSERLSVLGDGAKWIWDEAAKRFVLIREVDWCLDIFHVSEHVHACAAELFGPQTPGAKLWATTRLEQLIETEGPAFLQKLKTERAGVADKAQARALEKLIGYLSDNRDSLWYRSRLAEGKAIGTGLVEGAGKTVLGARLKLNSARWRIRRAERMGALRCLDYSDLWEPFWEEPAA
jgi:hypothetical protein